MTLTTTEDRAATEFQRFTADHEMTVLHDDGLYRHLRFKRPDSSTYYFDLVTWPGHLAINGDLISGYTFSRTRDMFEFFDEPDINPGYWSEKITNNAARAGTRDYEDDPADWSEPDWEWSLSFLLSCHAIRWGVEQWNAREAA